MNLLLGLSVNKFWFFPWALILYCGTNYSYQVCRKDYFEKFGPKILGWQASCQMWLTKSNFFFTKGPMDQEMYINECLKKRLTPLLRKNKGTTLFWLDLATIHYAKSTLEWYISNNVEFLAKDANPSNVPKLRLIQNYWALVKQKLRKSQEQVKTIEKFRSRWNKYSKEVTQETIIALMAAVSEKANKFENQKQIKFFILFIYVATLSLYKNENGVLVNF